MGLNICLQSFQLYWAQAIDGPVGWLEYLIGISVEALFYFQAAIWASRKGCIVIPDSRASRVATCITKVLEFSSNTALTNSFLSMSSIYLVVSKASAAV